ncbi:hypothetical protein KC644_01590 [Candidatus Berkelbacteria bacterium]|nr:hypothetical protein [Candidatus Berkelbacteria bacterium]
MTKAKFDYDKLDPDKTLVLVDAMAMAHRSFYAIPPLSKRGQPTNAVYGFGSTLLHVLDILKPKHIAVAYDEKGPTIRHEEFKDYKATRTETPDALKSQFPLIRELVAALAIPSFSLAGYEADDIIGALANQATKQGLKTIIVTGDHDLYQLVNDTVWVYNVSRGNQAAEMIDPEAVFEKYGFDPLKIIDYKGLRGDTSDNIPGVPGVGPKTAKTLIAGFGTVEAMYQELECETGYRASLKDRGITEKLWQKLCEHKDQAILSKRLATIRTDIPAKLNLPATVVKDYDEQRAKDFITNWGFRSLLSRLPSNDPKSEQESLF